MSSLIQEFNSSLLEGSILAAIARGVPEDLARARGWSNAGLWPTAAGTLAFVSFGDGKTILAEATETEWREAICGWELPKSDAGFMRGQNHPQLRNPLSMHEFSGTVGNVLFCLRQEGCQTGLVTIAWHQLRKERGGLLSRVPVEQVLLRCHYDGTVKIREAKGSNALTWMLLGELGIEVVEDHRPSTPQEALVAHRQAFMASHAPTSERQAELQTEFAAK